MLQSISVEANKPLHHRWMMLRLLHKLIRVLRSQYLAHVSPWTNLFFFFKDLISRLKEQQRASWMILTPGMNSNNFFLIWFNFESFYRKSHFILRFLAAGYGGTSVFQVNHFAFTREQQLTAWDEKTRSACGICVSTSASPFSTHFFFLRFALWDF